MSGADVQVTDVQVTDVQVTDVQVTVVIPLFNDAATIGGVLAALAVQTGAPAYEVIAVDDGSTDQGPALVNPPARLIRQANAGPAAARNRGAAAARGDILLFLDADCIPPANWIRRMSAALRGRGFDAVMGTLGAANDGVVVRLVQLEVEDRYRGMAAARAGVDFIAAPACGMHRAVFMAIGGFDETLRQAEDVEIAYRLTGAGHRIAFVADAPVLHAHQTTWRAFLRAKYQRATGRLRVFGRFPEKRRHDSWTPLALKAQFGMIALSVPLLLAGLFGLPWAAALGGLSLLAGVLLAWPLILATARREAPLIGFAAGLGVGVAFVILRSLIILAAMLRMKVPVLWRRGRTGAP